MWIQRGISKKWGQIRAQPLRILIGPRQVGKSAFLSRSKPPGFQTISFDDINFRDAAAFDPKLFLDQLGPEAIIDEAQYAPNLFPELKRRVDILKSAERSGAASGKLEYWLTGSNRILLDNAVSESLTGRASYFRLHTLSASELAAASCNEQR